MTDSSFLHSNVNTNPFLHLTGPQTVYWMNTHLVTLHHWSKSSILNLKDVAVWELFSKFLLYYLSAPRFPSTIISGKEEFCSFPGSLQPFHTQLHCWVWYSVAPQAAHLKCPVNVACVKVPWWCMRRLELWWLLYHIFMCSRLSLHVRYVLMLKGSFVWMLMKCHSGIKKNNYCLNVCCSCWNQISNKVTLDWSCVKMHTLSKEKAEQTNKQNISLAFN